MLLRLLTLVFFFLSTQLKALEDFKEGSVIRDAEIERILKSYINPLFEAAGLNPKDLNLYLIISKDVNAAASNNHMIFVNTGIILKMQNAGQLIGVLAHETSHISGGHVARVHEALDKAGMAHIISMVLAGAAAVAGQVWVWCPLRSCNQQRPLHQLQPAGVWW